MSFCVWTATLGKILTLDNLGKRNVIVVDWYCICKKGGESNNHLFLHCEVVRDLWSSLFYLFGVDWVMPRRLRELLVCWSSQMGNHNDLEVWRLVPLCLM
jgi:hypothetical protein